MDVDSDNEIGTPRKRARMVPKPGPASSLRSSTGLGKQSRVQNSQFSETNPKIVVTPQGLLERCYYGKINTNFCYIPMFVGQPFLSQATSTVLISIANQDWANIITTTALGDVDFTNIKLTVCGKGNANFSGGGTRELVAVAISDKMVDLLKKKKQPNRQNLVKEVEDFFGSTKKGILMEHMTVNGRPGCCHEAKLLNLVFKDDEGLSSTHPVHHEQEDEVIGHHFGVMFDHHEEEVYDTPENVADVQNESLNQSQEVNAYEDDDVPEDSEATEIDEFNEHNVMENLSLDYDPGVMFKIPGFQRQSSNWAVSPPWKPGAFLLLKYKDTSHQKTRLSCYTCFRNRVKAPSLPALPWITVNKNTGEWYNHPCNVAHNCEGIPREEFVALVDERVLKKALCLNPAKSLEEVLDEFSEKLTQQGRAHNIPEDEIQRRIYNVRTNESLKKGVLRSLRPRKQASAKKLLAT